MAGENRQVSEIDPPYAPDVPAAEVLPIENVRPLAEKLAGLNSLTLAKDGDKLVYEENNKGDIYFFRWDSRNQDWSGTDWMMMPPFLQVGMSADGKLVSFYNTLDLPR